VLTIGEIFVWVESHLPLLIFLLGGLAIISKFWSSVDKRLSVIPEEVVKGNTKLSTQIDLELCRKMVLDAISQNSIAIEDRHDRKDQDRATSILDKLDLHNKVMTDAIHRVDAKIDKVSDDVSAVHKRIDNHLEKQ
jgi:hypothetical protein